MYRQLGRVDGHVRHRANGSQLLTLFANTLRHRSIGRHRMRPAGLAEAPHQRRVARLEEGQLWRHATRGSFQPLKDLRELTQELRLSDVDHDCNFAEARLVAVREL